MINPAHHEYVVGNIPSTKYEAEPVTLVASFVKSDGAPDTGATVEVLMYGEYGEIVAGPTTVTEFGTTGIYKIQFPVGVSANFSGAAVTPNPVYVFVRSTTSGNSGWQPFVVHPCGVDLLKMHRITNALQSKNKQLVKEDGVWYLTVDDDGQGNWALKKELRNYLGEPITDLTADAIAQEMATI